MQLLIQVAQHWVRVQWVRVRVWVRLESVAGVEYYVTVHVYDPEVLLMWLVRLFEYAAVKWILACLWSLAYRITNYSVANLEVAERHAWKGHVTLVLGPVLVRDQIAHHVVAERVVLGRQNDVEEEQLTDHVDDVEDLRDDEQYRQVAATPASHDTVALYE